MNRLIFLISIILVSYNALLAQKTTLSGNIPDGVNYEISVQTYSDLISNKTTTLADCRSDSVGNFSMTFELYSTIEAIINLNFCSNTIFLEPGKNYFLQFDSFLSKTEKIIPVGRCTPSYSLLEPKNENELNYKINQFNNILDSTIIVSTQNNRVSPNIKNAIKKSVSEFKNTIEKNIFLERYIENSEAELLSIFSRTNKIEKYRTELERGVKEELNPAFRSFFNSSFNDYVFGSRTIPLLDIQRAIMVEKSRDKLLDIFGADTLLRDEQLRELVVLKSLKEFYGNSAFDKNGVLEMLKQFSEQSKWKEHRKIANNLYREISLFSAGEQIPNQLFFDENRTSVYPSEFSGKYLYICFFNPQSQTSINHLVLMEELFSNYEEQFEFLAISILSDANIFEEFMSKNSFSFPVVRTPDIESIKKWRASYLPLFVLADKEGKIISFPADSFQEGIGNKMEIIMAKERQKNFEERRR